MHFLGAPPPRPFPGAQPVKPDLPITPQTRTLPAEPCVQCHRNFFPLGYALENFDPIGGWRTDDQGGPVDASGASSTARRSTASRSCATSCCSTPMLSARRLQRDCWVTRQANHRAHRAWHRTRSFARDRYCAVRRPPGGLRSSPASCCRNQSPKGRSAGPDCALTTREIRCQITRLG